MSLPGLPTTLVMADAAAGRSSASIRSWTLLGPGGGEIEDWRRPLEVGEVDGVAGGAGGFVEGNVAEAVARACRRQKEEGVAVAAAVERAAVCGQVGRDGRAGGQAEQAVGFFDEELALPPPVAVKFAIRPPMNTLLPPLADTLTWNAAAGTPAAMAWLREVDLYRRA